MKSLTIIQSIASSRRNSSRSMLPVVSFKQILLLCWVFLSVVSNVLAGVYKTTYTSYALPPRCGQGGSTSMVNNGCNNTYFNVRTTPTRPQNAQRSTELQTRSTAISLTEADLRNLIQPNMTQRGQIALPTTILTMDIGVDDRLAAQTWTFPTNTATLFTKTGLTNFITPSSVTPASAQVAGATHVAKRIFMNPANEAVTEYTHYQLNVGQDLNEMGATFVENGIVFNYGETAQIYCDAPLELNDVFTQHITHYEDETDGLPRSESAATITVDAFGTINNPLGATPASYNCLRLTIEEKDTIYTTNATTPSSTTSNYYVVWVTQEGFRFAAKKPTASTNGVQALSQLEVLNFEPTAALSVDLLTFTGKTNQRGVDLTWTTASEKNNAGFEVERSTDGKTFETIGFVGGKGTTMAKSTYHLRDESLLVTNTYFRLQQIDTDGSKVSSNVISLEPTAEAGQHQVYPNPAKNTLTIALDQNVQRSKQTNTLADFQIFNTLGQTVLQGALHYESAAQNVDISALAQGMYIVQIGTTRIAFVKQ